MILLLRHLHDPLADAVARLLGARVRQCRVETSLAGDRIWHRVGPAGAAFAIEDRPGSPILDTGVSAVLNRVRCVPPAAGWRLAPEERDYFAAEAEALLWSCLASLACPVINPPETMRGLNHPKGWAALAARCGVPTADFALAVSPRRQAAARRRFGLSPAPGGGPDWLRRPGTGRHRDLWAIPDGLCGPCDGLPEAAAREFAAQAGIGFGRLRFDEDADGVWRLATVDTLPAKSPPEALHRLAGALLVLDRAAEDARATAAAP